MPENEQYRRQTYISLTRMINRYGFRCQPDMLGGTILLLSLAAAVQRVIRAVIHAGRRSLRA